MPRRRRSLPSLALPALLAPLVLFSPTSALGQASQPSAYTAPPPGTVRVIATKVRTDPHEVTWRWTVITDREFASESFSSEGSLELRGGVPGAGPAGRRAFVRDVQITARLEPGSNSGKFGAGVLVGTDGPHLDIRTSVSERLTNGHSRIGGGTEAWLGRGKTADGSARALFTGDRTLPLPLRLPLFEYRARGGAFKKDTRTVSYLIIHK
jgi:hypothetical protein